MSAIIHSFEEAKTVTPDPLPLSGETVSASRFPLESLGPIMEGMAHAVMRRAFVPAQTAVQSLLSTASLALQPHLNIALPTRQVRPISLYMVTIAKSGARKSTSDDLALTEVGNFQRELDEQHKAELATGTAARAAWDASKAEAMRENKKGGVTALARALEGLGPRPPEPEAPVLVIRSGTTQGLVKFFNVSRPSLGLMSDEGGSWLGGWSMTEENKLNTIATLSDLWDGKPLQRMTSGEGVNVLYGRRLAFHLMIQPILAGRLLGDAEAKGQGFLSRLLVAQPDSLAGQRIVDPTKQDDPRIDRAMSTYAARLGGILRARLPIEGEAGALAPRTVHLTDEATTMWWEFYNALERRVGPGGELEEVDGFVGKLPEQAARIATVLAAFEQGLDIQTVDVRQLSAGIEIASFYLSEAQRLFGVAPVDPLIAEAQVLSDWLRDKWPENLISIRRISQAGPNQIRKLGSDRIRQLVEVLARHNHVGQKVPGGGPVSGKHTTEAWRVYRPRPTHV